MIEVNVEDEKLVFYSGGRINDAKAFTEANPDYFYFDDIFDEDFQEDFGGANLGNEDVAKACSKAMGWHAKGETRVFGDKDGELRVDFSRPDYILTLTSEQRQHLGDDRETGTHVQRKSYQDLEHEGQYNRPSRPSRRGSEESWRF
jgi:hypothetical protein